MDTALAMLKNYKVVDSSGAYKLLGNDELGSMVRKALGDGGQAGASGEDRAERGRRRGDCREEGRRGASG